jgi:hypothetical protein
MRADEIFLEYARAIDERDELGLGALCAEIRAMSVPEHERLKSLATAGVGIMAQIAQENDDSLIAMLMRFEMTGSVMGLGKSDDAT